MCYCDLALARVNDAKIIVNFKLYLFIMINYMFCVSY